MPILIDGSLSLSYFDFVIVNDEMLIFSFQFGWEKQGKKLVAAAKAIVVVCSSLGEFVESEEVVVIPE